MTKPSKEDLQNASKIKADMNKGIVVSEQKQKEMLEICSEYTKGLNERECSIVFAIVEKDLNETWEAVAERLGISSRWLWKCREQKNIQDAVRGITRSLLRTDTPDVLKAMIKKAKSGDNYSMRLFFELSGELEQVTVDEFSICREEIMLDDSTETVLARLMQRLRASSTKGMIKKHS